MAHSPIRGETICPPTLGRGFPFAAGDRGPGVPEPLAIAAEDPVTGLLLRVGEGRYLIPLSIIVECVALTDRQKCKPAGCDLLLRRDKFVPILRLREIFGVRAEEGLRPSIVILRDGDGEVGLVVDQIIGQSDAIIQPMPSLQASAGAFCGAAVTPDHGLILILDIPGLVRDNQQMEERFARAS